jgi:malate synthase
MRSARALRWARITRAGFFNNIDVCVRYLAAWLDGLGCVPIHT